ncbi:MAG: putative nucleotidyltransferase substrate binding domain-containing protein [Actinomycetes bacterium]
MELTDEVREPLELARGLGGVLHLAPLDGYADAMTRATSRLLDDGADALHVTQAVAAVNDVLTSRLLALAEAHLGPPPFAYAWLALGSHGRGEQVLSSDQDSALAYGGPRLHGGPPREYYPALAALVVDGLARAGIPRCSGGYMATTWWHPLEELAELFRRWVDHPLPAALLRAEVFLDVRPVHGDLDVAVLGDLLVRGGGDGTFVLQMARAAVSFRPPRIIFGRLHTDHGVLDVKRAGTAAIVLLARLYALAAGSAARTTTSRLEAAREARALSPSGVEQLTDAYRLLTELRLRHQVQQVRAGQVPDNRVRVDALSRADQRRLRDAVRTVRVVQEVTENRYATHTVT